MIKWISNKLIRLLLKADFNEKAIFFENLNNSYLKIERDFFRQKYKIDKTFKFNGVQIKFYGDGEIICGSNSYIGNYSTIQSDKGCKVIIGRNCAISHNVRIYSSSYLADQDFSLDKIKATKEGDVFIGDGVWIGANVFINPGVKIGNNTVIGANSVVTKDMPNNVICGGVPCKIIREKN